MTIPELLIQLCYGLGISCSIFFVAWLFTIRHRNAALADIAWSFGFTAIAIYYCSVCDGWLTRKIVLLTMISVWSLRLGFYLLGRTIASIDREDTRYNHLRQRFRGPLPLYFLWIFFCQALLQTAVSVPFLLSAADPRPGFTPIELASVLLFVPSFLLEIVADRQLAAFKRGSSGGAVCKAGLWRYSRHPNYFFEWLIWCSFAGYASGAPEGPIAVASPLIMLFMLLFVSGVRLSEEVSLKSRGEEYRRYQRETSAFVPWFVRRVD
ncbi:MAG: DUF1295 domain-containing protein [Candidatus Melainabacteria bacterium]|nr:DUF1295 domain-containing protein [Candidatus Melainabacteria bacterium]